MKRIALFIFSTCTVLFSCSLFEEDHEVKEVVRKYLNETLHDPGSMEELNWRITRRMSFTLKDSLDENSPLIVDREATYFSDEPPLMLIRLQYRAKNGFGAMRRGEIYAFYFEDDDYVQFEDAAYSFDLESFLDAPAPALMEPRYLFLRNEFLFSNDGEATIEDFWREYPEYN